MSIVVFGYQNRVQGSGVVAEFPTDWLTTLPTENMTYLPITRIARTISSFGRIVRFTLSLNDYYAISAAALLGHNLSAAALIRVRAYAADHTTVIYNSGWFNAWNGASIPTDLQRWENDNAWLGTLSGQARAGFRCPVILLTGQRVVSDWWYVELDDISNPDGYLQLGRVFLSDTWTPEVNRSYGDTFMHEDEVKFETSLGGQEYPDQALRYRVHKTQLDYLSYDEAYSQALRMQAMVGISGEILVVPDPGDATNGQRRNFVGRFRAMSPITQLPSGQYSMSLELKELL